MTRAREALAVDRRDGEAPHPPRRLETTARGVEPAMGYYGLLDRTPMGRNESDSRPLWVRRHDEYDPE